MAWDAWAAALHAARDAHAAAEAAATLLRGRALHTAWRGWRLRCMRAAGKRELLLQAASFLCNRSATKCPPLFALRLQISILACTALPRL
jgi:hypothetical protein